MLTLSQILAIAIFILMFVAIIVGKVHRYIPALIAAALTLVIVFLVVMKSPQSVSQVVRYA
jgi:Na+/H+ antiporter NhaD/arsenite permease-like protein